MSHKRPCMAIGIRMIRTAGLTNSLALWLLLLFGQPLLAQIPGHTYPLIGWQTFGGAVDDYYARHDLLVYRDANEDRVLRLKQLNPKIKVVYTIDWNIAIGLDNKPDEWFLKDSRGNRIHIYGGSPSEGWPMLNLSDFGPRAQGGAYAGKKYLDYLVEFLAQTADLNTFDGWGTDGVWGHTGMSWKWHSDPSFNSDVDINNNGVNDHNEFSKEEWLNHWQSGLDAFVAKLRAELGDKLLIVNSGTEHKWGLNVMNGVIREKFFGFFDAEYNSRYYNSVKAQAPKPFASLADGLPSNKDPDVPSESKNHFKGMRQGLIASMFNDVYYSFQDFTAGEHYWSYWYDEFDANLGMPTGSPREIREGLVVRFFDRGAAIMSTNGHAQNATDSDLRGFSEYNGPYYRFRGGQDPAHNSGQQFTEIQLRGVIALGNPPLILGDGIILFDKPTTLMADLIIDNVDMGTSPGQRPPRLSSGFSQEAECGSGREFYTLRCTWNPGTHPFAVAAPGSGVATFKFNIAVSGSYEVLEWHGEINYAGGATNAKHVISHAGGTTTKIVDQRTNRGRWNSLGVYQFGPSGTNEVRILADGANDHVMADALKLVYQSNDPSADLTPPGSPRNVRVN